MGYYLEEDFTNTPKKLGNILKQLLNYLHSDWY